MLPQKRAADIPRDESTFDNHSLTLPATVSLGGGFDLSTAATRQLNGLYGRPDRDVPDLPSTHGGRRELGSLDLVTVTWSSDLPDLTNLSYAFTTPLGSQVRFQAQ